VNLVISICIVNIDAYDIAAELLINNVILHIQRSRRSFGDGYGLVVEGRYVNFALLFNAVTKFFHVVLSEIICSHAMIEELLLHGAVAKLSVGYHNCVFVSLMGSVKIA